MDQSFKNGRIRGIVFTEGGGWTKQRRFGLKTLKDLGFGRRSIEEIVDREIDEIIDKFCSYNGQDFLLGSDFSIPVINVLWQLVAGHRFDENHSQDRNIIKGIDMLFETFIFLTTTPLWITKILRKLYFEKTLKIFQNQINFLLGKRNFNNIKNIFSIFRH